MRIWIVPMLIVAVLVLALGVGLMVIAPTDTSVKVYSSGGGSSSYNGWPATTNWEPSKTTNLTGVSFLLQLTAGKSPRDVDITFNVVCHSKAIGSGAGRAYVTTAWQWFTVPTYEAQSGKVSGGFTKGEPCSVGVSLSSPGYNIYEVRTPANGRMALTVWGYEAPAAPPPSPPPTTQGPIIEVEGTEGEEPPPPEGETAVPLWVWLVLALAIIVIVAVLAARRGA